MSKKKRNTAKKSTNKKNNKKPNNQVKNNQATSKKTTFLYKDYEEKVDFSGQNRWSATFGMLSGNKLKLMILNIIMFILLVPTLSFIIKRDFDLASMAQSLPFTHNVWNGGYYPPQKASLELLGVVANTNIYLGLAIFAVLGSLIMSGGYFLLRNFVWTNGVFEAKSFFKGIKNSFLKVLVITILYVAILIVCIYSISLANYYHAYSGGWYFILAIICATIVICLATIIYLYACSFTVTYKLPILKTIVCAFKFTFNFLIPNLFFLLFSILPFILLILVGTSGLIGSILTILIIMFGIIFFLLTWQSYTQFAFDKVITGEVDKKDLEKKEAKQNKKQSEEIQEEVDYSYVKPVTDNMELEQLPEMFSRKDLERLEESKKSMKEDSERYYEERKNKLESGEDNE